MPKLCADQLDTSDRWQVRDFYNYVYPFGEDAEMQWTGAWAGENTDAGTVSDAWLEATRMRINFYRAMAGVEPRIVFDPVLNAACQASSLILSANAYTNGLTHFPPQETSLFWTQEGYNASASGNIAFNSIGIGAVDGYMVDFGAFNESVGHRRWIFYPQAHVMGSGDVPGQTAPDPSANTIWVQPPSEEMFGPRPPARDKYIAWPPPGNVPSELVWSRWSFSYPGIDFDLAEASVTMTGPNGPIPLQVIYRTTGPYVNGAPESSIVWVPDGMPTDKRVTWPTPVNDEAIEVTIWNVTVDGESPVTYTVNIFDANKPENESLNTVTPPGSITTYESVNFTAASRTWSEGLQGRSFKAVPADQMLDAEGVLEPFIADTTGSYLPITDNVPNHTSKAYHLVTPTKDDQTLTIQHEFLIGNNSPSLQFDSSLGWSTVHQVALVEINLGEGHNWQPLWQITGWGLVAPPFTFEQVSIDLSPWSGQTASIRFRYYFSGSNNDPYFYQVDPDVGWAFDNVSLSGVSKVTNPAVYPVSQTPGEFSATFLEAGSLYIQARDIAFTQMDPEGFALDWGPVIEINPSADGFTLAGSAMASWTRHPTVGWMYRAHADWAYTFALGWIQIQNGPWLKAASGWFRYVSGNITEGIWLFNPVEGFIWTQAGYPGKYLRDPFTGETGTWGSFLP